MDPYGAKPPYDPGLYQAARSTRHWRLEFEAIDLMGTRPSHRPGGNILPQKDGIGQAGEARSSDQCLGPLEISRESGLMRPGSSQPSGLRESPLKLTLDKEADLLYTILK